MSETWGAIAKAETARRKCLYFDDVLEEIQQNLTDVSATLIAAACAERLILCHML